MAEMVKVVFNEGFGGFGLSPEAICLYKSLQGVKVIPYFEVHTGADKTEYYQAGSTLQAAIDSGSFRSGLVYYSTEDFGEVVSDEEKFFNKEVSFTGWDFTDSLTRHDPLLVQVVETLKDKANGRSASLKIRTIPAGQAYTIKSYDGAEQVLTKEELLASFKWTEI